MQASRRSLRWVRTSSLGAIVALALTARAPVARATAAASGATERPGAVDVRMVTDEADAVLAILAKRRAHEPVGEADWQRLFASEGYLRLQRRERAMKRSFEDSTFRAFLLSDSLLARAPGLERTLAAWTKLDMHRIATRPLAYLPADARIRAKVYPVIKPRTNTFVFEVKTEPAIFLYLDPAVGPDKLANTVAHELHHIGFGSSAFSKANDANVEAMPQGARDVYGWIGAFGEGFAMLAAAGGPDHHPQEFSTAADRARWDHDVAGFNGDLAHVQAFFTGILDGKLGEAAADSVGMEFFGEQGPWYTVGWKMASVIETTFGHDTLLACIADHRQLLPTFNRAAPIHNAATHDTLATWSPRLLERLAAPAAAPPAH